MKSNPEGAMPWPIAPGFNVKAWGPAAHRVAVSELSAAEQRHPGASCAARRKLDKTGVSFSVQMPWFP